MEKDFVSGAFFSDNERYADIINSIGCDGVPFVKGKDLQEMDTRGNFGMRFRRKISRRRTMYRDLLRKTPFGVNFAIVGIENQEETDYALPLRIMCYDAGEYERQAAMVRKEVRRNRKGLTEGEYLYGFKKNSRLLPTVTFVLYYGEKEWDGAKDIHGLLDFTDIPESLRRKISNYRIHVVEVRKLSDTSMFKTDVKQVFDFIRFSKDRHKLRELVTEDAAYAFLEEDAYDMVACYVGEKEMFRLKEKHKKGGKVNMCQGLREWMEEERSEGKLEGKAETLIKSVESVMLKFHVDLPGACEGVGITQEEYDMARALMQKETNDV
ncbi:MAG: Rpn family recombination-promoting nuclease/putative transposase [Lachnospiraceae bacterium]|nr:Rpn family recombination-promoting nuclease/putative transposase [Lachnospiraceae bacterium]